jgi:hypothetical protein
LQRLAGSNLNNNTKNNKNKQHCLASTWQLFSSLDENGSGKIGIGELKKCFNNLKISLSDSECRAIVKKIGNDGMFDLDSFVHFVEIDDDLSYVKHRPTSRLYRHLHHHKHYHLENDFENGFDHDDEREEDEVISRRKSRKGTKENIQQIPKQRHDERSTSRSKFASLNPSFDHPRSMTKHDDERRRRRASGDSSRINVHFDESHRHSHQSERRIRSPRISVCDPHLTS